MGKLTIEELEKQTKEIEELTKSFKKEDFDSAMSKIESALNNIKNEDFENTVDDDDLKLIYDYHRKRTDEIDKEHLNND